MAEPRRKVRRDFPPALASDVVHSPRVDFAEVVRGLSSAEAEALVGMTEDETYASRTCVFSLGDQQMGLYLVKEGLVEEYRLTEDGNKLPITRSGPGKFLALASVEGRYCCFAEAVEESVVGFLSFQKMEDLCRRFPRSMVNLIEVLVRHLGDIEERLEILAFGGLRVRVIWALLSLYASHGPRLTGITQEALGEWAASSRPKVSMVLQELQEAKLLRLSRGEIEVLDPDGLQEWVKRLTPVD